MSGLNEADTCRRYVVPKLQAAGWDSDPHRMNEQVIFTDGRIVVSRAGGRRREGKRADYILRYRPDTPIAVVEAKPEAEPPSTGLQQAKDYAEILGLRFAYATNGHGIVEFDFFTGLETELTDFPTPADLWMRLTAGENLQPAAAELLLTPCYHLSGKSPRYYQEIAINRAVQGALTGRDRILLTMATGTGKTVVAFQICWKLWNARWNRPSDYRRPRMLYLADRNILIDDPKDKTFAPFGDARWKIENGQVVTSREMYFAIYQAIARDEVRPGLYREFPRDFFDLIIVDECHRGSARDESCWREILEWFSPACQIGMTATPKREDNADTYAYFGEPLYTYSLRQGIEDGFLAPYRVHRIITTWDAAGWRPNRGELDRFGREIPDGEYFTNDFERRVAMRARTEAVARHLTEYLRATDRFAKTIVFCVDQEHADEMRRALNNLNADLVTHHPDWVCRVTADEGDVGRRHLDHFIDLERTTPVVLTSSQLLTTGVDAPTVKNVALVRVVGSMTEFKQIIGRGTRVREDYGKLFFSILDYTGSATRHFADPDFDGEPVREIEARIDEEGALVGEEVVVLDNEEHPEQGQDQPPDIPGGDDLGMPRKFYVDGGWVEIAAHMVYDLDPDGRQLRVVQFTDYAADNVRTLFADPAGLRREWADPRHRKAIVQRLEERGIDFDTLAEAAARPDADPLDLLCHLAFNAPLLTRSERARRLLSERRDFFASYGSEARQVLEEILDKYALHGISEFELPAVLEVSPINRHGTVMEIAERFGGAQQLVDAVTKLQELLYAA